MASLPLNFGVLFALLFLSNSFYVIFPAFILFFYGFMLLAQYLATTNNQLITHKDKLIFKDRVIEFKDVDKFLISENTFMSAFMLRLNSGEVFSITYPKRGSKGKKIKTIFLDLILVIKEHNSMVEETDENGMNKKMLKRMRPIMILLIPVVFILDLIYIYMVLYKGLDFTFKILLPNVAAIALVPYLIKTKV